jgi:hypothetical protein
MRRDPGDPAPSVAAEDVDRRWPVAATKQEAPFVQTSKQRAPFGVPGGGQQSRVSAELRISHEARLEGIEYVAPTCARIAHDDHVPQKLGVRVERQLKPAVDVPIEPDKRECRLPESFSLDRNAFVR